MEETETEITVKQAYVGETKQSDCVQYIDDDVIDCGWARPETSRFMLQRPDYVRVNTVEDVDLMTDIVIQRARISKLSNARVRKLVAEGLQYNQAKRVIIKDNFFRRKRKRKPFNLPLNNIPLTLTQALNQERGLDLIVRKRMRSESSTTGSLLEKKRLRTENVPEKLAVVCADYPGIWMNSDRLITVQSAIMQAYDTIVDQDLQIRFSDCVHKRHHLVITCADVESAQWLRETVSTLQPWPGAALVALEGEDVSRPWVYTAFVSDEDGQRVQAGKILTRLQVSNRDLKIDLWSVLDTSAAENGAIWTFFVDRESLYQMRKLKMSPFFGMGRLRFRITNGRKYSKQMIKPQTKTQTAEEIETMSAASSQLQDPQTSKGGSSTPEPILIVVDDEGSADSTITLSE